MQNHFYNIRISSFVYSANDCDDKFNNYTFYYISPPKVYIRT